jgi:hypothetical protein
MEVRKSESSSDADIIVYSDGETGTWMMDQRSFLEVFVLLKPYEPEPPFKVTAGNLYRHIKSGRNYAVERLALREEDEVLLVVYRDVDQHPDKIWVRPHSEFLVKFTPIGNHQEVKTATPEERKVAYYKIIKAQAPENVATDKYLRLCGGGHTYKTPGAADLLAFLEELKKEHSDLSSKTTELLGFLFDEKELARVPPNQRLLMNLQVEAMRLYHKILGERIKDAEAALADAQQVHTVGTT